MNNNDSGLPEFFFRHLASGSATPPIMDISRVEVQLSRDGPLGQKGDRIFVPFDEMILPAVLGGEVWQPEFCEFLTEQAAKSDECVLLDIGANCGLITRQLMNMSEHIDAAFCIEPDRNNFSCLQLNLEFSGDMHFFNVGLSKSGGRLEFYRERENCGNFSFNRSAVDGKNFETVSAETVAVESFFKSIAGQLDTKTLLWKSDTQGFDELIVSNTPDEIWSHVSAAVIEVWRIPKPEFDVAELRRKIDVFPNKVLGGKEIASSAQIIDYLSSTDRQHCDLWLWR
jgi:FkbM family methyltransferase